jgi:hypothetical protein
LLLGDVVLRRLLRNGQEGRIDESSFCPESSRGDCGNWSLAMSGPLKSRLIRRLFEASARRRVSSRMSEVQVLEDRQLLSAVATRTSPIAPSTSGSGTTTPRPASFPLSETFNLSSRPGATKTIYLDFDGHTTAGTAWNTAFNAGNPFTTPAFSLDADTANFSDAELTQIQNMWLRTVEDFAPFDVNVTTKVPDVNDLINSGGSDNRWGMRVVIGGDFNQWFKQGAGGVAYLGSFGSNIDVPCFVFSDTQGNNEQVVVETISHEVGHTLGLDHDGTATLGYYGGHGTGVTGWGPIMGAAFGKSVTQWSKGEYTGANNFEDDLSVITTQNGFGYRPDDYGNNAFGASVLPATKVGISKTVNVSGVIERNTDLDVFSFTTTGGVVNLTFSPAALGANLDMSVTLLDGTGTPLASINPADSLGAVLSTNLLAGTYFIVIDGVGNGNLATGYSDYGSIGQYTISGSIPDTSSGTSSGGTGVITGRVLSNTTTLGIAGVMVFLDINGNGVFNAGIDRSTRTDSTGNYRFTGLRGGLYAVQQITPNGWQQTIPVSGALVVPVTDNLTTGGVNFRNVRPPALGALGSAVTYKTGTAPVLIASIGTVVDLDTTQFGGARLNVSLIGNGQGGDLLAVRNQGNGAGQVSAYGGVLRYSGLAVGAYSGGGSGTPLVITFNNSATTAIVQVILRNITFSSSSTSKLTRTVSFSMTDGKGGTSSTLSKQVKVT